MVFHIDSKRRPREKPQTEAHTTFLDLPDELVLAILERTDSISAVLRLRQTSQVFVPACNNTIRKELKTLYIHPRLSSVEQAMAICKSGLGSAIEEICFINKIRWDMIRVPANFDKRFGHSWPSLGLHERKNELNLDFPAHYEELLAALATLPSAKTLSFREMCDRPGFNMVSERIIYNWAFTVIETARTWDAMTERRSLTRLEKAEAKLYGMPKVKPMRNGFNFSDLDVVVAALGCVNITTLKLSEELPFAIEHSLATATLGHLTHIELLVHLGWQKSAWQRFCQKLLRNAAPTLQTLKLTFKHNPATAWRRKAETSFATIIKDIDFPKLRSLELRALDLPEQLPYVPQIVDFMAFLSRCTALKFFRTSRVFPTLQHIMILIDPDDYPSMDRILSEFKGEARALEEPEEMTRAWEMNVWLLGAEHAESFVSMEARPV